MEPGEALSTASQLAMALAGFASVVVAFRSGALHDWAPIVVVQLVAGILQFVRLILLPVHQTR